MIDDFQYLSVQTGKIRGMMQAGPVIARDKPDNRHFVYHLHAVKIDVCRERCERPAACFPLFIKASPPLSNPPLFAPLLLLSKSRLNPRPWTSHQPTSYSNGYYAQNPMYMLPLILPPLHHRAANRALPPWARA